MDEFLSYCRGLEAEQRASCRAMYLWNEARNGRAMPGLSDVGFIQTPDLTDNLFVVATGNGGGRFVVRRSCRLIAQLYGGDPLGISLGEALPSPLGELAMEWCNNTVLARQPLFNGDVLHLGVDLEILYRIAFMPLSQSGQRVDHLLGAISFRMNRD
ncbi:MAG: hypothetical protein PVG98_05485 [Chromatiales bacterium]|jgi:hypothetical protein